jgi:hypothetical protein
MKGGDVFDSGHFGSEPSRVANALLPACAPGAKEVDFFTEV